MLTSFSRFHRSFLFFSLHSPGQQTTTKEKNDFNLNNQPTPIPRRLTDVSFKRKPRRATNNPQGNQQVHRVGASMYQPF